MLVGKTSGPGPAEGWWIPLDGRSPQKVDFNVRGLRTGPDGRHFAYTVAAPSQPSETWVLERFLPLTPTRR
jgi:hypothetical protein